MPSYLNKRNKKIYEMKKNEKLSHKDVAEKMRISVSRVSQILSEEYKKTGKRKPTDRAREDLQEIIRMYNGNIHPKAIATKYGVSDRFIRSLLEKHGVYKKKIKPYPKSVNHSLLSNYNNSSLYFMGVFTNFGFFGSNYIVGVENKNKKILDLISVLITAPGQPRHKFSFSNNTYKLTFVSKSITNFLHSNGFTDQELRPENGVLLSSHDFWRGVVDSCGDIGLEQSGLPYMTIKTKDNYIKNAFILFLKNNVEVGVDVTNGLWSLTVTLNTDLPELMKLMFLDASKELRLPRNYERALMICEPSVKRRTL